MSVADQITRLNTAKADIKTAIESHSITVPSDAHIDTYDDYIKQIGDSTYWTHDWKWKRPAGWPDIDTLYDNSPNYCWMVASFDCRRRVADSNIKDGFVVYFTGTGTIYIERYKLVDGEFVLANTETFTSGTYFELLPTDEGDYVVYRIRMSQINTPYARFGGGSTNTSNFDAVRKSNDYTVYNTTIMELIVNGSRSMNLPAPRSPYLRRYEVKNFKSPSSSYVTKWANLRNNPSLEYLDASFDTTNGNTAFTALNACFFYNRSLKVLKLNNWNVANVTTLADCFAQCSSLERIEGINTWNTAKVTSLSEPFYNCTALKEINVSNWNTALVTTMVNCFYMCSSLETIDISGWNTVKVTNMSYMFYRNLALKSLTIGTNFVATALTNMSYMFANCISMTTNPLSGRTWASGKVTNYTWMFYANYALTEMDMSNWDLTKVTSASYAQNVFAYCYSLRKVVLPSTTKAMYANYFDYCYNLETIIINATTPPTWAVTTTYLGRLHPNYKIYVPMESVNSYKAASGWANAASHIYSINDLT